jgi:hypothetical protein
MKMNASGESGADGGIGADKSSPKDAQVMAAILKDMGIMEYEPRVINQVPILPNTIPILHVFVRFSLKCGFFTKSRLVYFISILQNN